MATLAAAPPYTESHTEPSNTGIMSWLTTVDHKRIGVLYLVSSLFFFVFGGLEAGLLRAQLATPNGNILSAEMYNQMFTMHGTTMIFLAVMPLSAASKPDCCVRSSQRRMARCSRQRCTTRCSRCTAPQ